MAAETLPDQSLKKAWRDSGSDLTEKPTKSSMPQKTNNNNNNNHNNKGNTA